MRTKAFTTAVLLGLLVVGCSQSLYMQGRRHLEEGRYNQAVESFYAEISVNPSSARAWRELGVAYYNKGNLTKAEDILMTADSILPDARARLYLGMLYEKQDDYSQAIDAYAGSLGLQSRGETANMTRAHLDRLRSKQVKFEISSALENEATINFDTIPENTIAVADFDGSHLPPEIAPLSIGLSEFIAIDLAKIQSLTVIERLKIHVIQEELKLSASKYVDPSSAPRMGRLMGSRRLITGTVLSIGDEGLLLDGVIVSTKDSTATPVSTVEGNLKKFFELQKNFVFGIIDDMGIELSADERDAINEIPTESYLAFMAYCRGLDYQNRGLNKEAEQEFLSAVQQDKNFKQAGKQQQVAAGASGQIEKSFEQFEAAVGRSSKGGRRPGDGLDSRLRVLARNTGTIPDTRTDDRRPADAPPVVSGTGTISITGDLDGQ